MNNLISAPLIFDGINAINYGQKRPKGNGLRRFCYPDRYPKTSKNFNGLTAKGNRVTGVTPFLPIHVRACVHVCVNIMLPRYLVTFIYIIQLNHMHKG